MKRISLKIILNIAILGVLINMILPSISFAQSNPQVSGPPETLEEARNVGIKALKIFPAVFKGLWQEALGVWQAMFRAIKSFWGKYIQPWLQSLWEKIKTSLFQEGKRRKPIIEEEFKKEKTEMRKEIKTQTPKIEKSIWEKFKDLIK